MSNQKLIARFVSLERQHPGPLPFSLRFLGKDGRHRLLIFCCTHGNEIGSLPPVLDIFESVARREISFSGELCIVLANPKAMEQNTRFVEKDLNRMYHVDTLRATCSPLYEVQRAQVLAPLLSDSQTQFFLDLHQTQQPTLGAFYLYHDEETTCLWAQTLGGTPHSVIKHPIAKKKSLHTQEGYAHEHGIPALTLELGVCGLNASSQKTATHVLTKAVTSFEQHFYDGVLLKNMANQNPPLSRFSLQFAQPFSSPLMKLRAGLRNLDPIEKEEPVGEDGQGGNLFAPMDGLLLFPKYPQRNQVGEALHTPHYLYELACTHF